MNQSKTALFPLFADQLNQFESELAKEKLPFYLFMGLRSWEEQNQLYMKGRAYTSELGRVRVIDKSKIVTNAQGGDSWHNYGLAADYVLDGSEKPGIQWSWETKGKETEWKRMAEIAVSCGLEPGYYWKSFPDLPHVQNRFGLTLIEAKELYRQGGLVAVWYAIKI